MMEESAIMESSQQLFDGLSFTIIPNAISEEEQAKLTKDITASGGIVIPFDASHGRIDKLNEISYIISTTSDFPDYHRALDLFKHVVKPSWVSACLQTSKVKNPRVYSPDPALFMNEVVVCCGDLPEGDKEAIEGGVLAMGGQYATQLTKFVTHLIALSMDDPRCQLALSKRLRLQIVLPHWFDDCLRIGRRLSERPYTLPDPEVLNTQAGAIPPTRTSNDIREATTPDPRDLPITATQRSGQPRAIRAFSGKKIMLSEDLSLSSRLKDVIISLIHAGGGTITHNVDEAHMYVCNYRDGPDYIKASQARKDVGNLSWLYWMITHDTWTNPMRRMMHYPRPRGGIPGFDKYKISISSYTGDARVYLENLVRASGAEFTKTFKQDNTHLITAHKQSEKCEAAEEWNVHVVNHLWLEESYAKCKEQTLTDSRYVYFPSRTNLGEILGQTEIDRDAVEKAYFSKAQARKDARGTPLVANNKRKQVVQDAATPVASRHADDKENETPGTTGSRGAKDRALSRLHEAAPDIAKFEKEMKRKGGVIHGGRREKDLEVVDKSKKAKGRDSVASKRSIDEVDGEDDQSDASTDEPALKSKRAKKDKMTPIKYRMLISKDDRWLNNPEKESKDKARLRELGLFITEDYKKVDLLCAPTVVRTKKFVAALACGPTVVASSYLDFALVNNKLPPPEKHLLRNHDFETQHGFRLDEALERAKQNQKRLLRDWTIFCTEGVTGGYETFKEIIVANGGQCHLWKGRATKVSAYKRTINTSDKDVSQNQEEDEGDGLYLISEAKKSELPLWTKFRELAQKHDMIPRIVTTEWILFVAMAQYVHWDEKWELKEEMVKGK
ncbi:BRCT domain-containing protein [Westerdykella ornata]|uniref:BRCT domain-containing protein n=1 Tax=Westerdykella ornata TaxID=318751 RepID=A0A6A6JJ09_WESOR|nr:BRCT domain-containing protein [Westerdykella ornata]KAF2276225.1 BRCT domain-containing protein [Westerdykella ornata]